MGKRLIFGRFLLFFGAKHPAFGATLPNLPAFLVQNFLIARAKPPNLSDF